MRFKTLLLTSGVMASTIPATLLAQKPFEGVITWGSAIVGGKGQTVIHVKGTKLRTDVDGGGDKKLTTIRDEKGRVLMLIPPKKMYMNMGSGANVIGPKKYESTGRKETIAGYPCEYYRELEPNGRDADGTELCVTQALGFIGIGPNGPMSDEAERAIHQQFHDGFFVLKTLRKGKTGVEVVKVEKTSVDDALFQPPSDYTEAKMPGRPE